jgi:hypothetical protein
MGHMAAAGQMSHIGQRDHIGKCKSRKVNAQIGEIATHLI